MIFTIRNNVPTITLEGVNIPEFKAIWMNDPSEEKILASKELAYVYHMASPKSSYAKLSELEKEGEVRRDFIGKDDWEPSELVLQAINKFKKLNTTELMRLLDAAASVADKLADYFNGIDFEEVSMQGLPKYEAASVINSLSKLSSVVKSIRELREQVNKEQELNSEKVRGNVSLSIFDEDE
jgi:hypothetical protein